MSYQTPWSSSLEPGNYEITIIDTQLTYNGQVYNFVGWQDQLPSLQNPRVVALTAGQALSLMAVYQAQGGGNVTPTTLTLPSGSHTISMPPSRIIGGVTYNFLRWRDNNGTNPVRTFNLASNMSLFAEYTSEVVTQYNLTIVAGANGSTLPSAGVTQHNSGSTVSIQATPNNGFQLSHWLRDGVNVGNTNPYPLVMDANHTMQPVFTPIITTVTLTVVAGAGGTVSPSGVQQLTPNQSYQFFATEGLGYDFDHWDLAGANKGSDPHLILLIDASMNNQTLTALFTTEPPPQVTVTLAVVGNGNIDIGTGAKTFNVGDTVTMTAIPKAGETFNDWQMNGTVYTDNPLSLTITQDMAGKTLTANFTTLQPANIPIWILLGVAVVGVGAGGYYLSKKGKKK